MYILNKGTVSLILSRIVYDWAKRDTEMRFGKRGQDGRMSLDRSGIFHTNDYTTIRSCIISMHGRTCIDFPR